MPTRGVLFDLDGTLVDNMRFHFAAWRAMVPTLDDESIQRRFAGKKNEEIIPELYGPLPAGEIARIAEEKEALYRAQYAGHVRALPGAVALIDKLRAQGIKVAVASAAPPKNRAFVLDQLGLRFDAIAGGEEVARGKPSPDIFLLAADRLSLPASACVVFEDASLGVRAGVAAGCRVIALTTSEPAHHLLAAGAERAIADFTNEDPSRWRDAL